ncbi:MAG: hypothetical protein JRH00_06885 [Deltaproteobacteria bacterium]|nr:hypothetical protein [Deltaproteobacteria bacterium]
MKEKQLNHLFYRSKDSKKEEIIMRVKNFDILFLLGLVTTAMFLSGCAYKHANLISQKGISIETIHSAGAHISDVAVSEDDNELVITGKVYRLNPSISGRGHVDVTILDSAGNVIEKGTVPYTPTILPKTPGARKHRGSRFEVRLPCVLPAGSKVEVAYHARLKPESNSPDCERSVSPGRPSISK